MVLSDTTGSLSNIFEHQKDVYMSDSPIPQSIKFLVRENGGILHVPARNAIVIGRRGSTTRVDVDLADFDAKVLGISRNHAVIEVQENRVLVRDLNSVNGSFLNGDPLDPMRGYEIEHCDTLKLGRMHLQVFFIGPDFEVML